MDRVNPPGIFDMELDDLRERAERACEAITRVHGILGPLLRGILHREVQPLEDAVGKTDDAAAAKEGDKPAIAVEDATEASPPQNEDAPPSEKVTLAQAFDALGEVLTLVTDLLPGLISLTPEERLRIQSTQLDPDAVQEFFDNYTPPPRLPDTAPTAEELQVEQARDLFERSRLISKVQEAFEPLLEDLQRAQRLLGLRLGRIGSSTPPAGNN